mmetsp:Transcript_79496/g.133152  ORF Transcript_79496/g.133152 Transcript_79496/m.133152 type:complete len:81 (+) Transcript_79496:81-323(+)
MFRRQSISWDMDVPLTEGKVYDNANGNGDGTLRRWVEAPWHQTAKGGLGNEAEGMPMRRMQRAPVESDCMRMPGQCQAPR